MLQKWKKDISQLANDQPGERFINHYKRQRQDRKERSWKAYFYIVLGILLVVTGILLSIPPLLPGFIITLAGLSLIASQLKLVSKGLDQGELLFHRAIKYWKENRGGRSKNSE